VDGKLKVKNKNIYSGVLYVAELEKIGEIRGFPLTRSLLKAIPLEINFD
jgi:hypothetical protein